MVQLDALVLLRMMVIKTYLANGSTRCSSPPQGDEARPHYRHNIVTRKLRKSGVTCVVFVSTSLTFKFV